MTNPTPHHSSRALSALSRGIPADAESYDLTPSPLTVLHLPRPCTCDLCGYPCATALLLGWRFAESVAVCLRCEDRETLAYADETETGEHLPPIDPELAEALRAGIAASGTEVG